MFIQSATLSLVLVLASSVASVPTKANWDDGNHISYPNRFSSFPSSSNGFGGGVDGSYQAQEYVQAWQSVTTSFDVTLQTVSQSNDYQSSYQSVSQLQFQVSSTISQYRSCQDCDSNGYQYKDQYAQSISTSIHQFQEIVQICKTRYAQYYDQYFADLLIQFQSFFTYANQSCGYFGIDLSSLLVGLDVDLLTGLGIKLDLNLGLGLGVSGRSGLIGGGALGLGVHAGLGLGVGL